MSFDRVRGCMQAGLLRQPTAESEFAGAGESPTIHQLQNCSRTLFVFERQRTAPFRAPALSAEEIPKPYSIVAIGREL